MYFDLFSDRAVKIPFNTPCARLEGGLYTTKDFDDPNATCYLGFPEGEEKLPTLKRDYVVDVDMGTVNNFFLYILSSVFPNDTSLSIETSNWTYCMTPEYGSRYL